MHNKRPAWNKNHAGLFVSHEAFRRMAACTRQLAGNPARPASRGTFRATAVKPRPTFFHVLLRPCAAEPRSPGSRGTAPCASRGTFRATAVKPRPTGISPYAPARIARSPGSRGTAPCASRDAFRATAVKPRPSCFLPERSCAPTARSPGCRGHPCQTREPRGLSPSGGKTPANQHVPRAPCAP